MILRQRMEIDHKPNLERSKWFSAGQPRFFIVKILSLCLFLALREKRLQHTTTFFDMLLNQPVKKEHIKYGEFPMGTGTLLEIT